MVSIKYYRATQFVRVDYFFGEVYVMKHIKAILATLVTMVGISACNSRNISSDSSMESTTNHSQSSLADSEITSSIDKDDWQ